MTDKLEKLIGAETEFPIQHRILNVILLIGIVLASLGCVFFAVFDMGSMPLPVNVTSTFIFISLYYWSMKKKQYSVIAFLLVIFFGFIVVPLMWISNGGIAGGTPYYALIYAAMITTMLRGTTRIAILACFLSMVLALMVLQYINPAAIMTPYTSEAARQLDMFFAFINAVVAILTFFVIVVGQYIKEHQRLQKYLSQLEKQKMEIEMSRLDSLNVIGEMAASIGHEVRNPLTTVRGFLQLFQRQQDFSAYAERFEVMIGELDRANQIITEFLSLAKNKAVNLKPDNLNRIIGNMNLLIQSDALLLGKQFVTELTDIPDLLLDENEIRQCVVNLVRNGFEATGDDGVVVLRTYTEQGEVVLSVQDNGQGIPSEIYAKLGTPFLTSKPQGTGLGLAVCYRVAERHHAKIKVQTGPTGTIFRIGFGRKEPSEKPEAL